MSMMPFYTRFPELAARETRSAIIQQPGGDLPPGEYGFMELYCDEPGCDCRRVLIQVFSPPYVREVLATINYGWESVEFYTRWMHGDADAGHEITAASLDPLNPQSKHADHLLDTFRDIVRVDPAYVTRLARHYELFKQDLRKHPDAPAAAESGRQGEHTDLRVATKDRDNRGASTPFEQLDDLMQQGYDRLESHRGAAACDVWLRAWDLFCALYQQGGFTSLCAFDERFNGTQFVANWVQDLEMELRNTGREDPVYHERRIHYCEDFLKRLGATDDLIRENMRRAVAESWTDLGQRARADALFGQWLEEDPQWGWGWIGWADTYFFCQEADCDLNRAEQLLKRGLGVDGARDRSDICERLVSVYEEQGRAAEAEALRQELTPARPATSMGAQTGDHHLSIATKPGLGEEGLPLEDAGRNRSELPHLPPREPRPMAHGKTGRNEPCPCGSGKKYKKCCGK